MITDFLLQKAINYCEENKGCSVTSLKAEFKLSKTKAYALLDILENEGVVEAYDGIAFQKFLGRGKDVFKWSKFFEEWQTHLSNGNPNASIFTFAVNNFKGPERK